MFDRLDWLSESSSRVEVTIVWWVPGKVTSSCVSLLVSWVRREALNVLAPYVLCLLPYPLELDISRLIPDDRRLSKTGLNWGEHAVTILKAWAIWVDTAVFQVSNVESEDERV